MSDSAFAEHVRRASALALFITAVAAAASAQDDLEQRVERLEEQNRQLQQQNAELADKIDILDQEFERFELKDVFKKPGESFYGLGPAASKVYLGDGLSVGGYGEILFQDRSGEVDRFDAQRGVLYVGYKFDEHWIVNSEIEIEHATTSASSGTTAEGGSASLEFAYLDYIANDVIAARGGLLLIPMGLINEMHEPTTYLAATRPQTESRILPSTWRENGLGVFGDAGGFEYRAYVVNGLDGEEFSASGIRDGRQKGNRAAAEDVAVVGRVDWVDVPGLKVGGSVYYGDSGQDEAGVPDLGTTLYEVHADHRAGRWWVRGLYAGAHIDDAAEFNAATGENLADGMAGYYVSLGYDVLRDSRHSLMPYTRYEWIDTQASVPAGSVPDPTQEDELLTLGLRYQPIPQAVLKLEYVAATESTDGVNFLIGYVF